MVENSSSEKNGEQAEISRRSTLLSAGASLVAGVATLSGKATTAAQAQKDGDTEDTSLKFFPGTEPAPSRSVQYPPAVEIENPPTEAEEAALHDVVSGTEIKATGPVEEIEGTVYLNSIGSTYIMWEDSRQAAKNEFEARVQDIPSLELSEELNLEVDIQAYDSGFIISSAGREKIKYVKNEDVELVFIDEFGEQIGETSEVITIQEVPETRLVEADPDAGFNYPYFLYTPDKGTDAEATPIVVEPNNTGEVTDDLEVHKQAARELADGSIGRLIAGQLQTPLVVPVFPRPSEEPVDWLHYVHALDDTTMGIEEGKLERVDLQLLNMVEDAQDRLAEDDYPVSTEGILLDGFSASGNFAERFTVLHPDEVISVTAGGLNGMPLLPLEEFDGRELPYHVGAADIEELTGEPVNQDALDETNQFLYMGAEDDNDTIPDEGVDESDAWTDKDLRQLALDVYGDDMITERFPTSQQAYQEAGVEAQFRIYPETGHTPFPAVDDIIEFHQRSIEGKDVSEFGQEIAPNPQISFSPSQASVGEEIEFDAGDSTVVPVEEILTYQWNFGTGTEAIGETTTHTYKEEGTFTIELTIITDRANEYQTTTEIEIGGSNSIEKYANEDGIVDTEGLQEASGDWRSGDIDTALLLDVFAAWQSGEPVA